jgi:hypothetical protein
MLLSEALNPRFGIIQVIAKPILDRWASGFAAQQNSAAPLLQFLSAHVVALEFVLVDLLGALIIWLGGRADNRVRQTGRAHAATEIGPISSS